MFDWLRRRANAPAPVEGPAVPAGPSIREIAEAQAARRKAAAEEEREEKEWLLEPPLDEHGDEVDYVTWLMSLEPDHRDAVEAHMLKLQQDASKRRMHGLDDLELQQKERVWETGRAY